MGKLIVSYILGILSFVLSITGVFSLLLSIPGFVLALQSLKARERKIAIPIGYQGKVGNKKISAQPYVSTRYLSYIAIVLNIFSISVSLFASFAILALFIAGTR